MPTDWFGKLAKPISSWFISSRGGISATERDGSAGEPANWLDRGKTDEIEHKTRHSKSFGDDR